MKEFVYVEWKDHCSATGWTDINYDYSTVKVASIGWIVKESKEELTITTCQSQLKHYRDAITILKSDIIYRCEYSLPCVKKFPWEGK